MSRRASDLHGALTPVGLLKIGATLAAALLCATPVRAAQPGVAGSPGDRKASAKKSEEAALLWSDGREAFQDGEYREAAELLGRFVQRYPGAEGYLEAHLLLGRARLELGRAPSAIAPLRYYVNGTRRPVDAAEGRLWLGQAYKITRKFHEAYFMALEVEKGSYPDRPDLRPRALILMSDAQAALGQLERAADASTRARQAIEAAPAAERAPLEAEWLRLQIDVKTRECALLPTPGPLTEDQARSQLERRGLCVLEALNTFRELTAKQMEDRKSVV